MTTFRIPEGRPQVYGSASIPTKPTALNGLKYPRPGAGVEGMFEAARKPTRTTPSPQPKTPFQLEIEAGIKAKTEQILSAKRLAETERKLFQQVAQANQQ
ncbi:MAG: hypothetical protein PHE55_18220 [Methylococcaceae bacterium]|nr:hypothetical protein [Methylococcaceae bacterium]